MKRLAVVLLLLLVAVSARGDEPARWKREWSERGRPMTKRLAFVLDVSGSMNGPPMAAAQRELLTVMGLFPDDGFARVYVFAGEVREFPGGWHKLPDGELLERVQEWLAGWPGRGDTDLGGGVVAALANPEDDLSVLLVTDGEVCDEAAHLKEIEKAQAKRKAGMAPVHVIGLGADRPFCRQVASRNGGSLLFLDLEEAH